MLIFYILVFYVTLYFSTKKNEDWKKLFFIHFSIQIVYSAFIFFGVYYISEGGTALGWTLVYMLILLIHFAFILISLIINIIKERKIRNLKH